MNSQKPSNRRAVLWNVQTPGDPYDIRKSMIARLPQHPARFMGDNLELVCLLQAAEIERLAQYLDEMTLEMRSLQRIELDRHSYEVQIKELAEKLQLSNQQKEQNAKLRQFIKGQSQQLQNLQRYRNSAQSIIELQTKYQTVLNQLRLSRDNYDSLKKTNTQTLSQLAEIKYRYERLQANLSEERSLRQREIKFATEKVIQETRNIYQSREYQLKGEITVMKENLMLKNQQITLEKDKITQLMRQLNEKEDLIGRYMRGEIETQSSTKTQEFLRISKRLEEATYLLEQKEKSIMNYKEEIAYLTKRAKQLEEDLRKRQAQLKTKQQQFNNNPQLLIKISELDQKLTIHSSEIQRLQSNLIAKQKYLIETEKQLSFYKQKSILYQKNIQSLKKDIEKREEMIRRLEFSSVKMADDRDGKIEALGNEVGRLNAILRDKVNQIIKIEARIAEMMQTEAHHLTLIRTKQQAIRVMEARNKQYQTKFSLAEQTNKHNFDQINRLTIKLTTIQNTNIQLRRQLDSKTHTSSTEFNQLKIQLQSMNQEISDKLIENKKLREDNQKMFAEIHELENRVGLYEQRLNEQKLNENHKLQQKQRQLQHLELSFKQKQFSYIQKIQMYSKSVPKMSQQIQRLHQLLQKRQQQIKRVQQDLQNQRQKARINERRNSTEVEIRILDYERNLAFYESKSKSYEKQMAEMDDEKTRVGEKLQTLENKLRDSHVEMDKIMAVLKAKENTFEEYQKRATILQSTINQLREQNFKLQNQSLKSRQQIQLNLQLLKKQQYELDIHKRDLSKSINEYTSLRGEYQRLRVVYEERESSMPGMTQVIDQLRNQLGKRESEVRTLGDELSERRRKMEGQEEEIRQLKIKLSEYQQSIKHIQLTNTKKLQQQRQRLLQEFQTHLATQSHRYSQLQQAYNHLQSNYQQNSVYFEDQGGRIQSLQKQNFQLRQHLEQYQQKVFTYEERIALLSQEIERLTMENKKMKGKVEELMSSGQEMKAMREVSEEMERTKQEIAKLRNMLQQYEAINQHTLAERDQLFMITHQQQQKLQLYQNELTKTTNQLTIKQQQLTTLRASQSQNISSQLHLLKEQYNLIHSQYTTLQHQHNRLSTELQQTKKRLSEASFTSTKEKEYELKQLEIKIHKITEQYETALRIERQKIIQYQQNLDKQSRAMEILQGENHILRVRVTEMQGKLTSEHEIQQQIDELKTAYINIKLQNQQVNRMLEQMQEQLFQANQQKKRLNNLLQQQQSGLRQENILLKQSIQQQRGTLQSVSKKASHLSEQIQHIHLQTHQKISSLTQTNTQLHNNFISLQQQNVSLKQQVQSLQLQISQLSVYQQISQQLQLKYNNLYQAYEETYKVYNEMKQECEIVKSKLTQAEQRISMLSDQFDKVQRLVLQLRTELADVRRENDSLVRELTAKQSQWTHIISTNQDLEKQLKRMYDLNQDLTQQLKQLRLRLTDQHALQQKIKHHMVLFVMLCAEIDSLRKRVLESEKECEEVRRSSISPIKGKK